MGEGYRSTVPNLLVIVSLSRSTIRVRVWWIFSVFIIAFYGPPKTERSSRTKRGGCFNGPSLRYGATDHTVRD